MAAERLPDLNVPRGGHAVVYADDGLMVIGGHTTGFVPTPTAERYVDGRWQLVSTVYSHDDAMALPLSSGRVLIAGGHEKNLGIGQSYEVEMYDPATHSFTGFGTLDQKRTLLSGTEIDSGRVVVSGNWYADDAIELFDGRRHFRRVKAPAVQRSSPFIFRVARDDVFILSDYDVRGGRYDSIVVDRLRGEPFSPSLLQEWRPRTAQAAYNSSDAFVGDERRGFYASLFTVERNTHAQPLVPGYPTGDVAFALLEASERFREADPALAERLREEARWGLDFTLRTRFGDGYRASSVGLLIWQDGEVGTFDDIHTVRVQDNAFDNYLQAGYEAYAARVLTEDPAMQERLRQTARADFAFAEEKYARDGYDRFRFPYEHCYNTSHSQWMATVSWAASQLYRLTGEDFYADKAVEAARYTLDCQETEPVGEGLCGFFYRDTTRRSIVHYIHQSREQVYMQALTELCLTQPSHPDYARWEAAIRLFGAYLKALMPYTAPYGMIPSGVYAADEYLDTDNFYALHLFPPADATQRYTRQLSQGVAAEASFWMDSMPTGMPSSM